MEENIYPIQKDLNILFVDNSKSTRFVMKKVLEGEGYSVEVCGSGQEAIDLVSQELFDVLVIDMFMPGMNGHEAAIKIRDLPNPKVANIPIIALSASSSEKDAAMARNAGMNIFVTKSTIHEALLNAIKKFHKD